MIGGFSLSEVLAFAAGSGFAGVVAVWFMFRHDKLVTEMRDDLRQQTFLLQLLVRATNPSGSAGMRGNPFAGEKH